MAGVSNRNYLYNCMLSGHATAYQSQRKELITLICTSINSVWCQSKCFRMCIVINGWQCSMTKATGVSYWLAYTCMLIVYPSYLPNRFVFLYAPVTLGEWVASFHLYVLHGASRNGKQTKNSKWKLVNTAGFDPATFRTTNWRLIPLGRAVRWWVV